LLLGGKRGGGLISREEKSPNQNQRQKAGEENGAGGGVLKETLIRKEKSVYQSSKEVSTWDFQVRGEGVQKKWSK